MLSQEDFLELGSICAGIPPEGEYWGKLLQNLFDWIEAVINTLINEGILDRSHNQARSPAVAAENAN